MKTQHFADGEECETHNIMEDIHDKDQTIASAALVFFDEQAASPANKCTVLKS